MYYSKTGNNKYLAEQIAGRLQCDILPIKPWGDTLFLQLIFSLLGRSLGTKINEESIRLYSRLIICGPIWTGTLIAPLKSALRKAHALNKELYFVTCCGSTFDIRYERFGYQRVFEKVDDLTGGTIRGQEAFPVELVLTEEERKNEKTVMEARLSDENFKGLIVDRLNTFLESLEAKDRTLLVDV